MTEVLGYSQMQDAVALAVRYDPDVLCEEFIDGEEVTCAVLGNGLDAVAMPVVRIAAPEGAYDYQNKYFTDDVKYHCPSGLPAAEEREIRITLAAYRTLGSSRLGPGRPDDPGQRPQALLSGDGDRRRQHDQPLAGADVGAGRRHRLRGPLPARAGHGGRWIRVHWVYSSGDAGPLQFERLLGGRRVTWQTASRFLDVRLMNVTATLVFVAFSLVLLAAGSGLVGAAPAFFPLAGIRADGEVTHVTTRSRCAPTPQLRATLHGGPGAQARTAFESVPWVRQAVVRREFPNRLRVTLTEQLPVVHWGDDSSSRLVNGFGEVFEANVAEVDDDLPRLDGPSEQAGQVLGLSRVLSPRSWPPNHDDRRVRMLSRSAGVGTSRSTPAPWSGSVASRSTKWSRVRSVFCAP